LVLLTYNRLPDAFRIYN